MALKREATASMFDTLKGAEVNSVKKEETSNAKITKASVQKKEKKEEVTAESKKITNQTSNVKGADQKVSAAQIPEKEENKITETNVNLISETRETSKDVKETTIKGFDFGASKHKELKTIRKQFVLTQTDAIWLKETAKLNEISENQVIANLIKMARDMQ